MVDLTIEFRKNKICFPRDKFRNSHWNVTLQLNCSSRAADLSLKETRNQHSGCRQGPQETTLVTSDHGLCLFETNIKICITSKQNFVRNSRDKHTTKWKSHLMQKSYFHSFHRDCHINQPNVRKPSFRSHSTETIFSL